MVDQYLVSQWLARSCLSSALVQYLIDSSSYSFQDAMGHAIGDWDNDGYLDWFSSAIWHNRTDCSVFGCKFENSGNVLFRNLGGRHFQEIARQVIKTFLRQVMNKSNSSRRLLQLAKHVHYIDLLRNFVGGITLNSQFYSALSLQTLNLGSIFWFSSSVSLRSECSIST